ncbi:MAG: 3-deoxy-7-phosphoheptulonate synthase [Arsenophonus sp.]|nr:MAG: 3-deoxy-7-phosphoheptulonate synthase [Arsenophonus sp.]
MYNHQLKTIYFRNIISPKRIIKKVPISKKNSKNVLECRKRIQNILIGQDKRLLMIIGPCSVHEKKSVYEYAQKLSKLHFYYKDYLEIVMRTYFEKPRTIFGWKGFIVDPDLNNSYQINKGLKISRKLLGKINNLGLPTATEFLDFNIIPYIVDFISWGAIGARTTENPIHRYVASGLPCPIGFKNNTNGDINVAINAVRVSRKSHIILMPNLNGKITIYKTKGNPYTHIIMRGGKKPNYSLKNIKNTYFELNKFNISEKIIIDLSHGNSQKNPEQQLKTTKIITKQLEKKIINISGIMVESFLIQGKQEIDSCPIEYGKSITDPCIGWESTKEIIERFAKSIKKII